MRWARDGLAGGTGVAGDGGAGSLAGGVVRLDDWQTGGQKVAADTRSFPLPTLTVQGALVLHSYQTQGQGGRPARLQISGKEYLD